MTNLTQQIIQYCKEQAPQEAVGLVVEDTFYPCKNVADNPSKTFAISEQEWRFDAQVVVHSHPEGDYFLSDTDRLSQARSGLEWWLVVNNKIKKYRYAPLLKGRAFKYPQMDCGALIEDAFMLMGLCATQFPRIDEKTDVKQQIVLKHIAEAGFYQVSTQADGLTKAKAGDVILTSLRGNANHMSLYLGNEQVLHHPYGGLSRVETLGGIWHKAVHSVWRHPDFTRDMLAAIYNDFAASELEQQYG